VSSGNPSLVNGKPVKSVGRIYVFVIMKLSKAFDASRAVLEVMDILE